VIYGVERWRDGMKGDVTVRISALEFREMGDEYVGYLLTFCIAWAELVFMAVLFSF